MRDIMFTKCIYCDKLHLCTYREKYHKPTIGSRWRQQISEAILPIIPEDARLRNLFQRWSVLTPSERATIDEQVESRDYIDLYTPLKEAMIQWENVQDTQGAPGFEQGLYTFTCDSRLEEELLNVIYKMDQIVESITTGSFKITNQSEDDISCFTKDFSSPVTNDQWALIPNQNMDKRSPTFNNGH